MRVAGLIAASLFISISCVDTAPTPSPSKPEVVLYEADWTSGFAGWHGIGSWSINSGALYNDGQGTSFAVPVGSSITAPYLPPSSDYVVEAVIESVSAEKYVCGIVLCPTAYYSITGREDSTGGWEAGWDTNEVLMLGTYGSRSSAGSSREMSRPTGRHTYRLAFHGSQVEFFLDGRRELGSTDSPTAVSGTVGIRSSIGSTIRVYSFRVLAP